jgi:hypothetical protein
MLVSFTLLISIPLPEVKYNRGSSLFEKDVMIYLFIYLSNKDWYEKANLKQPPPPSGFTANLQPKLESAIQIPPHTGFGSEHDSLGSVFSIHPKQEYRRTALIKTGVEVSCLNQLQSISLLFIATDPISLCIISVR